ncbi:MAG: glycosyltransferase family 2 protein [Salinivirgaceae bacterium]|nr:glycosyltransferase family 2 protein [Salinivirgaceae bacterium]
MQVSVIIVNYKNPPLILQCVKSILQYEKTVDYEIIVVDNDSQDDTEQQLRAICPNLKWIQMGYNSGFGRANNAGTRIAKGDFILFLNADTILIEPVFEKMATRLAVEPKIGAVGCRLLNSDKSLQLSYHNGDCFFRKLWWRNPLAIKLGFSRRNEFDKSRIVAKHNHNHLTRWICGTAVMMRRQDIVSRNLYWDEDFFMYWEDVELCHRIRKSGMKIVYMAEPSIIHLGGGGANVPIERFAQMEASKLLCIEKTRGSFIVQIYKQLIRKELRLELRLEKKAGHSLERMLAKELAFYGIEYENTISK